MRAGRGRQRLAGEVGEDAIPGQYPDVPKPIRSTVATFPSVLPTKEAGRHVGLYSTIAEPKTVSAPSAWRGAAAARARTEPRRASASGGAGEGATHTW